jgi:hypothetical protein
MSALGQKQVCAPQKVMSALLAKSGHHVADHYRTCFGDARMVVCGAFGL